MSNAVELAGVSKRYLLGEHHGTSGSLRDALSARARRLLGREAAVPAEELWSLRDVTLAVEEGDTLGLIGRNGAGKSTLLRIVTRITEPTAGVSRTRGRVGSLLEVGTGFHPELTGRENVYLNGAILGMNRRETTRQFDDIAEFAGVQRFLDTPVKRYSSGMYLRLAFAVAAHLDAEIMVVDEVLAVGDAEFQRKCLGKMSSLEREGRTVLFVSHNLDAIMRLCRTTAWLEQGELKAYGPTPQVVAAYLTATSNPSASREFPDRPDDPVALRRVVLLDADGNSTSLLPRGRPFAVEVTFVVHQPLPTLDLTVFVANLRGVRVLDEAWSDVQPSRPGLPGRYIARIEVPPLLTAGDYTAGIWLGSSYETVAYYEEVLAFRLEGGTSGRAERVLQLTAPWRVQRIDDVHAGCKAES
jgi:ABC-2 type transport system ATP-binding protein/lipopolysaccharide transport system ATP-binding protein